MTGRDRMVLMAVIVLVVIGGGWMLVVSPERKKVSQIESQVATARSALTAAEGQLNDARNAQAQYASAYASVVRLGKAVPASQEVPSLIYQLAQASHQRNVEFNSIVSSAGPSAPAASSASAAAAAAGAGFSQMPFTFVFNGGFFQLEALFHQLTKLTTRTTAGGLAVSGRLLTIQSVKLSPVASGTSAGPGSNPSKQQLSGTIAATAYVLPAGQALTGGATPSAPGAAASPASTPSTSSPTPAAVARVTP